jgi:hypothetical protein
MACNEQSLLDITKTCTLRFAGQNAPRARPAPKSRRTPLFQAIELKVLEFYHRTSDNLKSERGQTTSEYVAVTAVAVAIALSVIFLFLSASLTTAVQDIGDKITDFVANTPS